MSLDLIIGPMFSGKTTELIRRLNTFASIGKKCVYINSFLDNREEKDFSTHNPDLKSLTKIDSMKVKFINYCFIEKVKKYDVIGIDESQLFGVNLSPTTIEFLTDKLDKKIIMSGLNGDFKRNKFGRLIDLIPICDTVVKLYPYCTKCSEDGKIEKALFSKKINEDTKIVDVGYDNYIPVCRKCYVNFLQS